LAPLESNSSWTPVLASGSPRRIEMFQRAGIQPIVKIPLVSEDLPLDALPHESGMYLALKKALSIEKECSSGEMIIAADTLVVKDEIFGKPENKQEGFRMLSLLRGTSHQVITGVAILMAHQPYRTVFFEKTEVVFDWYSDQELDAYLNTSEPYDKAGGYAIQGIFQKYILEVVGDRDNVMGFPWKRAKTEWNQLASQLPKI